MVWKNQWRLDLQRNGFAVPHAPEPTPVSGDRKAWLDAQIGRARAHVLDVLAVFEPYDSNAVTPYGSDTLDARLVSLEHKFQTIDDDLDGQRLVVKAANELRKKLREFLDALEDGMQPIRMGRVYGGHRDLAERLLSGLNDVDSLLDSSAYRRILVRAKSGREGKPSASEARVEICFWEWLGPDEVAMIEGILDTQPRSVVPHKALWFDDHREARRRWQGYFNKYFAKCDALNPPPVRMTRADLDRHAQDRFSMNVASWVEELRGVDDARSANLAVTLCVADQQYEVCLQDLFDAVEAEPPRERLRLMYAGLADEIAPILDRSPEHLGIELAKCRYAANERYGDEASTIDDTND